MLLSTISMYCTLAICSLGLGLLVVKYDLHRHEPWWLLLFTTLLGSGMMELAGFLQLKAVEWCSLTPLRGDVTNNTSFALIAAVTEELSKFMVVCAVAVCFRKKFDEPLDGLIYGAFAGLGAAIAESVATLGFGQPSPFLPAQEPVRLAGHLIMGGIGGFGLGLITNRSKFVFAAIPCGLLVAIVLHWLWDVIAFDAADKYHEYQLLHGWHTALPVFLMIFGMAVFRWLVKIGSAMTESHLSPRTPSV